MPKWFKWVLGIWLLPTCIAAVGALVRVVEISRYAHTVWVALAAGAACWFAVFALLPRPMWIYVFGHELTHALWTWLCGGRVKRFKVGSKGGHVVITKTNSLIALAPYFFPIYAVLVALIYEIGHWIWRWPPGSVWLHLALGASYAFHLTLTWEALKTEQSDITGQGFFFSAVVITLGNLLVLLIGVTVLSGIGAIDALVWWGREVGAVYHRIWTVLFGRYR